jgi:hypothetical protein
MITIFACPKRFRDHINIIQRNAIRSWSLLQPKPEIILVGNDEGIMDICKEFSLAQITDIEKNEYGTPMVNSIFQVCQEQAKNPVVCYVNSDIILMNTFMHAVKILSSRMPKFLMIGQRWDVDIKEELNFTLDSWETDLQRLRARSGILRPEGAIDYFVFPRGMYSEIPPLAIGRLRWDNWLVWRARSNFVPIVDATAAVTVIHQNHDYAPGTIRFLNGRNSGTGNHEYYAGTRRKAAYSWAKGSEAARNDSLVTADMRQFGMWASTWILDCHGVLRRRPLSLNPAYVKYQLKYVLPLYSPRFGHAIRWLFSVAKALRRSFIGPA